MSVLRQHGAPASMLEKAELVDVGSYAQLSYRSKKIFGGEERWGFSGESAAFTDPFYSPGSDFIAIENDMLTERLKTVRDQRSALMQTLAARRTRLDQLAAKLEHSRKEATLAASDVDREARKGKQPSDHAPVWVELRE